jgi:hypothetical protein
MWEQLVDGSDLEKIENSLQWGQGQVLSHKVLRLTEELQKTSVFSMPL